MLLSLWDDASISDISWWTVQCLSEILERPCGIVNAYDSSLTGREKSAPGI